MGQLTNNDVCVGSGEVPGLYSPEELEPLLSSLKDPASKDGFTGPLYNYFSYSESNPLTISPSLVHLSTLTIFVKMTDADYLPIMCVLQGSSRTST